MAGKTIHLERHLESVTPLALVRKVVAGGPPFGECEIGMVLSLLGLMALSATRRQPAQ